MDPRVKNSFDLRICRPSLSCRPLHFVHGPPHSSGYRYSRTDTVEAMTALGRQPKVGKCVCICVGGGGGGGGIQSAEAEIGQMVTVRFKGFACPL